MAKKENEWSFKKLNKKIELLSYCDMTTEIPTPKQ